MTEIVRKWAMPNRRTFEIKPIKKLLEIEVGDGKWVDPMAGESRVADITNDLNKKYSTDYHLKAINFLKLFDDSSVDGVLYDPPYSPRQIKECYEGVGHTPTGNYTQASFWSEQKNEIQRIVKQGGKVISFGWNSQGMGKNRDFIKSKILLVAHGGNHNDTIVTVEIKGGVDAL